MKSGKLRGTAVTGGKRSAIAPDQYVQFLRSENTRWGNMARQLKLKAD